MPMKKVVQIFISCLLVISLALVLFSCSKSSVRSGSAVQLNFKVHDHDIEATLTEEEAARVIEILSGKSYDSFAEGIPSCGFDPAVSFRIDGRIYAIAMDTCGTVRDYGNLRFIHLTDEEIDYIHRLFEKYGGSFPCI